MRIELFLDEGEEYPQLFSVWKVDQNTGRADLTTRRNYVDDKDGWDKWRKTDEENIRLKAENSKLQKLIDDITEVVEVSDPALVRFIEKRMKRAEIEVGR